MSIIELVGLNIEKLSPAATCLAHDRKEVFTAKLWVLGSTTMRVSGSLDR